MTVVPLDISNLPQVGNRWANAHSKEDFDENKTIGE